MSFVGAEIIIMNPDKVELTNTEELRTLSEYAGKKTKSMQEVEKECADMSAGGRWWDSKVPEHEKSFFNRVNLTSSSGEMILEHAKTYRDFYAEIDGFVSKLKDSGEVSCLELRKKILDLKKKLIEVYQSAKREELQTSSKKVRDMHRSFINEYERLDCVVKDFENSALCDMWQAAQDGWRKALEDIASLREEMSNMNKKYDDVCDKFASLKSENKRSAEKQDALLEQNKEMAKKMDAIMEMLTRLSP